MSQAHGNRTAETPGTTSGPKGIGGWLILPLLGLIIGPVLGIVGLIQAPPTFDLLSQLDPMQGAFIIAETAAIVLLNVVAPAVLLILFFQTRASFPRLYQFTLAAILVWTVIDLVLAHQLFRPLYQSGQVEFWDSETVRALNTAIIGAAIWIPYMARSVRVRNTFVN